MAINTTPAQRAAIAQVDAILMWQRGVKIPERDVLDVLSEAILSGARIEPAFQELVNFVIAKAAIANKLPDHLSGAPAGSRGDRDAVQVAGAYFELIDGGQKSERAKEVLQGKFHVGKRQIERLIKAGKYLHGDTKAARDQERRSNALLSGCEGHDFFSWREPSQKANEWPLGLAGLTPSQALDQLDKAINPRAHTG